MKRIKLQGLPPWVDADDLRTWIFGSGLVADNVVVVRDRESQVSKGVAYIDVPNITERRAVIDRFDGAPLEDTTLQCFAVERRADKKRGYTIYLSNLPFHETEKSILRWIDQCGAGYEGLTLGRDKTTDEFRGYAFVVSNDPAGFIKAVDGKFFMNRRVRAEIAREQQFANGDPKRMRRRTQESSPR